MTKYDIITELEKIRPTYKKSRRNTKQRNRRQAINLAIDIINDSIEKDGLFYVPKQPSNETEKIGQAFTKAIQESSFHRIKLQQEPKEERRYTMDKNGRVQPLGRISDETIKRYIDQMLDQADQEPEEMRYYFLRVALKQIKVFLE